jgi:uncharacterized protein involved in outer membrane biogenesis
MKFLVRWAFRLFLLLIVLLVALVLLKDVLLKSFATHRIRLKTGMDVKIGHMELGLFTPTLTMERLTLYSPAAFGGAPFLDVPDLHLQYDPKALLRFKLHLNLVRLSVTEMNIVEAQNGQTNLVLLLNELEPPAQAPGLFSRWLGLQFAGIDALNLTLGKVSYTSLRHPGEPTEIKVGLKNEIITGVKSIADVRNLVMTLAFRKGITISSEAPRERRGSARQTR